MRDVPWGIFFCRGTPHNRQNLYAMISVRYTPVTTIAQTLSTNAKQSAASVTIQRAIVCAFSLWRDFG